MEFPWLGSVNSQLRQAAKNLGWNPTMSLDSIVMYAELPNESWFEYVRYPYSLMAAAHLRDRMLDVANRMARQHLYLGAEERKSKVQAMQSIQCSAKAEPRDVALANVLVQRLRNFAADDKRLLYPQKFVLHPKSSTLARTERKALASLVEMYISLGQVEQLAMDLMNDVFPGDAQTNTLALPDSTTIDVLEKAN